MNKISVIIPNYNHALYLNKRIESVLNQTYRDFEVLILDDCSTDHSRELIKSYSDHPQVSHIIFNEINSGSTFKQWEKGLMLAKGELIWIAESDDWADDRFLELLMKDLERDEAIGLIYCQSVDVVSNEIKLGSRLEWTADFEKNLWEDSFCIEGKEFLKYLFRKNVIPNASACICKKEFLINAIEILKTHKPFKMAGDWFTWLMVANTKDVKIAFVHEHLNFFRKHKKSTRIHNTTEKKRLRIIEEAIVFNSIDYTIDQNSLIEKNNVILDKWISQYPVKKLNFTFFEIESILKISKRKLLKRYLKNNLTRLRNKLVSK